MFKQTLTAVVALTVTDIAYAERSVILEEVVVTAEKRVERLQDVSLSISAISGESLRNITVENISNLAAQIPGLQVQENDLFPAYFIRGGGLLTETNDLNDQPVGIYSDEVYLGFPSDSRGQLFDVERIEVLRGPQGTLFGRNTTAGVIHYISKKPTAEFDAYAEAGYASFNRFTIEGAAGGPISEHIRVRAAAKYFKDDGWQTDRLTGQKFAAQNNFSGRVMLESDLSEDATLFLKFDYTRRRNSAQRYGFSGLFNPETGDPCSLEQVNSNVCAAANGYIDTEFDPEHPATDEEPLDDMDSYGLQAQLDWDLGIATLTSITAYRNLESEYRADGDATPQGFFGGFLFFGSDRSTDAEQFSQEIRLSGQLDNANWVAGAYYYEDERNARTEFPRAFGGFGGVSELETQAMSLFGQIDLSISDNLTIIGGVRYTDESKDVVQTRTEQPGIWTGGVSSERTTGRIALEWKPDDNIMVYTSLTTGYKSGTFPATVEPSVGVVEVEPEEVTTAELGFKSELLDRRLRFNSTFYYTQYRDFQSTGTEIDSLTNLELNVLKNVGNLEVYGLESEILFLPVNDLEIALGFTFTESEISAGNQASGAFDAETGAALFYDGKRAPNTPKYRINGRVAYTIPAGEMGTFGIATDFNWQSKVFLSADNTRFTTQGNYGIVNATLNWQSANEQFYGKLYVNNLTDQEIRGWEFLIGFIGSRATIWSHEPRSFGVKLGVRY